MKLSLLKKCIALVLISVPFISVSQEQFGKDSVANPLTTTDTVKKTADGDIIKTGYNVVPIPDLRYDPYVGLRMGAFVFLYDFGDGTRYPNFYGNTTFEASYGTKGATNARIRHRRYYGTKIYYAEINYQNQVAAPYFGINGFQQTYNEEFINSKSQVLGSPKNPLFYNYAVQSLDLNFEIQDTIKGSTNLNWLTSLYSGWYDINEVNLSKANKGIDQNSANYIVDSSVNLYGLNKMWGLVDEKKLEGGKFYTIATAELIYDKRDRINNPMKGVLSRVGVGYSPKLASNSYGNVLIVNASHSHYIILRKKESFKTSFAYRFKYLGYFGGQLPYHIQEGIGGIKSAWGVHQNRAMVRQWASGQFELRTKGFSIHLKKTNLDFWGVPFFHTGYVIEEADLDLTNVSANDQALYFNKDYGRWYSSYGWMGKMVINKNIALGFDLAFPMNAETGPPLSIFIGMGFSFQY